MFDRRLAEYFDWVLLGITMTLGAVGLVILYSALSTGGVFPHMCTKQIVWFSGGLTIMVFSFLFSYKMLDRWGVSIYMFSIIALICVLFFGRYVAGSRRWLVLGPMTVQPSEIAKITIVIILAKYYSKRAIISGFTLRDLVVPLILIAMPFMLIVMQPDLGTALVVVLIAASMTVFVKIEKRLFLSMIVACGVTVPLIWMFFLKGYQKQRILTFLNPDRDPLGAGYHIIQSKIAIGSGMFTGKGFLKGTQNALSFLPEQHTDFILSVLAEEWGFVGSVTVLLLYLLLIGWGVKIAYGCRDSFGTIMSVGITSMIFWQVFINVGMVMGLMPVVGVPLPLISYGGSSVVTTLIGIGILMNVSMRSFIVE